MKDLVVVVGARPNFVKVARFKALAKEGGWLRIHLVHTGQHTDDRMSTVFFEQFGMQPDHWLAVDQGSPNTRIAHIMLALEPVTQRVDPDAMMVVGDVDSTLAAALTANRMQVPLVHLESGLRNGDMDMPEEVNRILTDRLAQHHLVTEPSGREHLIREGIDPSSIHFVGNTMIDALVHFKEQIASDPILKELGLAESGHALVTLHRPATVDDPKRLTWMVELLEALARDRHVVFPIHPRTMDKLKDAGLADRLAAIPLLHLPGPLGHFAFQHLIATARFVLTDSGGVQEETTYYGIPCLTLRPSTERPITVMMGSNELVPYDQEAIHRSVERIMRGEFKTGRVPEGWDGHATERVFEVLRAVL